MQLRVAVGIPTAGRPAIVHETLREILRQVRQPDAIFVCCSDLCDVAASSASLCGVQVVVAEKGSAAQRNAILEAAIHYDIVVFFDDDFFPCSDYLQAMEKLFVENPRVVTGTGHVIADGICGPGISPAEGRDLISADMSLSARAGTAPAFGGYGCNMAIRMEPVRHHALRFDERLPLYGWQEDNELSRRLGMFGEILRTRAARGVHLGVKTGRTPGIRLGYSQVANPLYIHRKLRSHKSGSYPLRYALTLMVKNVLANAKGAFRPEPFIDRRGRLRGNLLAFRDLIGRRLTPERILQL